MEQVVNRSRLGECLPMLVSASTYIPSLIGVRIHLKAQVKSNQVAFDFIVKSL